MLGDTTQPRNSLVTMAGPLAVESGDVLIELERLVAPEEQQRTEAGQLIGGINDQTLYAVLERMNTLPGCHVCAQLMADVRLLLIGIYKMQERTLKIAENRLEDDEEMGADDDVCCCCSINLR